MNNNVNESANNMFKNVPVTVREDKKWNGLVYEVWTKKDLLGASSRMVGKEGDEVINHGEVVIDPATGGEVHLIRIKRKKRVWYGKGIIPVEVAAVVMVEDAVDAGGGGGSCGGEWKK
jgi:hypothetical protein